MATSRKILKKLGIGIGILFGVLVLAALIVPLVVNVDDYRPKIVAAAEEYINGKLELGKLSLSLWGSVKVKVDGFALSDVQGRKIVSAKDVYFYMPFTSLLSGAPQLTLNMQTPELNVVKDKKGKLNVLSLVKNKPEEATKTPTAPTPTESKGGGLPKIAVRARLGIEMVNAYLAYKDEKTALTSVVKDLNVKIKDLSLSHPMDMDVWANLDTRMGKTLTVKGPAKLNVQAAPRFTDGSFTEAAVSLKVDLDDLEILVPPMFEKRKGVIANANASAKLTPKDFKLDKIEAKFHNAVITGSGLISNLDAESKTPPPASLAPELSLKMASNDIALKPWAQLIPMLKEYDLGGAASLDAVAGGSTDNPNYRANLKLKSVTAKAPQLKAQPTIDGQINVVTDKIENLVFTMKAPGNDLKIAGKVISFTKPKVDVAVTSSGMDLDQLIDFPKPPAKAEGGAGKAPEKTASKGAPEENMDAMLDPLRENKIAADTTATFRVNLASVKAKGVKITPISGQMTMRDLGLALEQFKMGVFGGTIGSTASVQLKPKTPTYRFTADVANLDLKQAVTSQLELFKNTLFGTAFFKIEGNGASFNPNPAKANLNARGNLKVANATFATIDVGRVATEAATKALDGVLAKVPQLKNQAIKPPGNIESKYEYISSDFTIAGGVFKAPNFMAKAVTGKGLDIKGATTLNIVDYGLNADWQVLDTYNLTKLRDIALDQGGVRAEHVLAEGNNPVTLPIKVGGTAFAPAVNYGAVVESLAKIALNNVGQAVANKAKSELQQKAQEQLKQLGAPAPVQDALQGLGKKLFGN